MHDLLRITIKTAVFFIIPGTALYFIEWQRWDEPYFVLITTIVKPAGLLLLIIGIMFFVIQRNKSKRKRHETDARKKIAAIDKRVPLAYERTEPLTERDIRFINRQIYGMIVVMALVACVPLLFLFLVDEDQRVYIYTFMIAWVCVVALIGGQTYTNFSRIREDGKKTVVKGIITDRFMKYRTTKVDNEESTTATPYLRIGDTEVQVTITMHRQYNVGDAVEFHYAEMFFFGKKQHNTFFTEIKIAGADMISQGSTPAA